MKFLLADRDTYINLDRVMKIEKNVTSIDFLMDNKEIVKVQCDDSSIADIRFNEIFESFNENDMSI